METREMLGATEKPLTLAQEENVAVTPPEQGKRRKASFFSPLGNANFRRLIGGQTVSRFGDQFYFVAIPWLVLRTTNAPIALAVVLGSASATLGIFTLIGGALADRYGPRKLMLGADIARFCIVVALATVALVSVPPLWLLAALSALLGVAAGLFYPASSAIIPHLVPGEDLQAANSFDQLTLQSGNFLGPTIAGIALSLTQLAFGFVVDAATFAVSVVTLFAVRTPSRAKSTQTEGVGTTGVRGASGGVSKQGRGGIFAAMGEAIGVLRASPFLLTLIGTSLLLNFAVNGLFDVALPLLLKQWVGLSAGPRAQGFVIGGFGLGSILGAVAAGVAGRLKQKALVAIVCLLPVACLVAIMPFVGNPFALAGLFAVAGFFIGISNVLLITIVQQQIALDMMGRMMSIVMLGSFVATPLSTLVYGVAASVVPSIAWLFIAGGALFGVGALAALLNKRSWQHMEAA